MRSVKTYQLLLEGGVKTISRVKFEPGEYAGLRSTIEERRKECLICNRKSTKHIPLEYHASPWNDPNAEPDRVDYFCRVMRLEDRDDHWRGSRYESHYDYYMDSGSDWSPMHCDRCGRDIIQRNPRNGWRSYFTTDPEDGAYGELCCVRCAQDFYMEHGHTDEQLETGRVNCDWYNHDELKERGFVEDRTFVINSTADLETYRAYCRQLKAAGHIVLTDQGATGYGFSPDDVTVWYKPAPVAAAA